ncbi:asparagine synthase (glutamine-hydrolyzing) [Pedobacter sp. BS3]|uniref:asparagine synthase (glutamine-hydrolyzing) n=1 Tax=Pedobacter sp. BS3 TaxID=2567937 RepID=UPI0011ECA198|nr:asparagine synthase (glutamine-hydrolyzing) [Pedobacter sp. BS3]TZF83636.1 asparagine synthase (glutamine-hydrolyzing) [Pedobacter sp. BS3]
MCGITGFVDFENIYDLNDLRLITDSIRHRGPDDSGYIFEQTDSFSIGFGNRRLSVIDLSERGHQPFCSPCGNYVLVFNGMIYNYRQLQVELIQLGIQFRSNSDTEVLLQAILNWPDNYLTKIEGIFSFAFYDKPKAEVHLVRDPIGVKPLFYTYTGNTLVWGSELRTFLINRHFRKQLDIPSLNLYFQYAYFPGNSSILKHVRKILPGEKLVFKIRNRELKANKYWQFCGQSITNQLPEKEVINRTHQLLKQSIGQRLVADVPIGVLLSGGYDSTTVAAIARNISDKVIKTFTVGFEEDKFNEAHYAKVIANYLGTEHHEIYFTQKDATDIIHNIGEYFDEPMGDSGAVSVILAAQLVKPYAKVVLSSEGGDELFGGYTGYFKALNAAKLTSFIPQVPQFNNRKLYLLNQKNALDLYDAITHYFPPNEAFRLTNVHAKRSLLKSTHQGLNQLLYYDLSYYLPDDLLMKTDRAMMHFGIENRDPLLSPQLVQFLMQLDAKLKCPQLSPKGLLKQITHQYIPQELLSRPKMGFSIPLQIWLTTLLRDFVSDNISYLKRTNLLDSKVIDRILRSSQNKPDYHIIKKVWALLAFSLWYQRWFVAD